MTSRKKDKMIVSHIGKAIIIALLIVFILRAFFIESFTISSSQMETSLMHGDKVFVDKTSYGVRMPIAILSLPFVFDSILGRKSYSTAFKFPYKRIFESMVRRNDIVLFNNPMETNKPIDKRSLLVSRCIALPDDTVRLIDNELSINGVNYMTSPNFVQVYQITNADSTAFIDEEAIVNVLNKYEIPQRNYHVEKGAVYLQLSRYESFIFNQNILLPLSATVHQPDLWNNYSITIPHKGMSLELNKQSLTMYGTYILSELGGRAKIVDGDLLLDDKIQESYTFADDYLWMLSDNATNSIDSRSIGFIPFSHIIGKVSYIWWMGGAQKFRRCIQKVE